MSEVEEFGKIQDNIYEERQTEWKIGDIFSVIKSKKQEYNSPVFCFADSSWRLQLQALPISKPEYIILFLWNVSRCVFSLKYDYGLKKLDGGVDHLERGILKEGDIYSDSCFIIKVSELKKRKSELAPSGVLTITCTLRRGIRCSYQLSGLVNSNSKKLIKLDTLSENFKDLLSNKANCDICLRVQEKEYQVHKVVLVARSSVFAAMFQHDTKERQTGVIDIPDCDAESFEPFLEFLYCGKIEMPSSSCALHLYQISDKYDVQELKVFCVDYLMQSLTVKDFCEVVTVADKYDETELLTGAQEFFNRNVTEILVTPEWECLMKNSFRLGNRLTIEMSKKQKM